MQLRKFICLFVLTTFVSSLIVSPAGAQVLPVPGTSVGLTPGFQPPVLLGLKVHPENPLLFDFIVDQGQAKLSQDELKVETEKLVKYFLAALTIPDKEVWVNLSPTEKDRIIPDVLGQTVMGKTMLEQDYTLKQLASSLTNPETDLGKRYWQKAGATPTLSKVWIVPEKAEVLESNGIVLVGEKKLKVRMDEETDETGIFRTLVLPVINKEVNESKDFADVRQIYNSVILATWYKTALKESLLGRVYADKSKVAGVETDDKEMKQRIYEQYLAAFKKGAYNLIKEEADVTTGEMIPRKYFSGGISSLDRDQLVVKAGSPAQVQSALSASGISVVQVFTSEDPDADGAAAALSRRNSPDGVASSSLVADSTMNILISGISQVAKDSLGRRYPALANNESIKFFLAEVFRTAFMNSTQGQSWYEATIADNQAKGFVVESLSPANRVLYRFNTRALNDMGVTEVLVKGTPTLLFSEDFITIIEQDSSKVEAAVQNAASKDLRRWIVLDFVRYVKMTHALLRHNAFADFNYRNDRQRMLEAIGNLLRQRGDAFSMRDVLSVMDEVSWIKDPTAKKIWSDSISEISAGLTGLPLAIRFFEFNDYVFSRLYMDVKLLPGLEPDNPTAPIVLDMAEKIMAKSDAENLMTRFAAFVGDMGVISLQDTDQAISRQIAEYPDLQVYLRTAYDNLSGIGQGTPAEKVAAFRRVVKNVESLVSPDFANGNLANPSLGLIDTFWNVRNREMKEELVVDSIANNKVIVALRLAPDPLEEVRKMIRFVDGLPAIANENQQNRVQAVSKIKAAVDASDLSPDVKRVLSESFYRLDVVLAGLSSEYILRQYFQYVDFLKSTIANFRSRDDLGIAPWEPFQIMGGETGLVLLSLPEEPMRTEFMRFYGRYIRERVNRTKYLRAKSLQKSLEEEFAQYPLLNNILRDLLIQVINGSGSVERNRQILDNFDSAVMEVHRVLYQGGIIDNNTPATAASAIVEPTAFNSKLETFPQVLQRTQFSTPDRLKGVQDKLRWFISPDPSIGVAGLEEFAAVARAAKEQYSQMEYEEFSRQFFVLMSSGALNIPYFNELKNEIGEEGDWLQAFFDFISIPPRYNGIAKLTMEDQLNYLIGEARNIRPETYGDLKSVNPGVKELLENKIKLKEWIAQALGRGGLYEDVIDQIPVLNAVLNAPNVQEARNALIKFAIKFNSEAISLTPDNEKAIFDAINEVPQINATLKSSFETLLATTKSSKDAKNQFSRILAQTVGVLAASSGISMADEKLAAELAAAVLGRGREGPKQFNEFITEFAGQLSGEANDHNAIRAVIGDSPGVRQAIRNTFDQIARNPQRGPNVQIDFMFILLLAETYMSTDSSWGDLILRVPREQELSISEFQDRIRFGVIEVGTMIVRLEHFVQDNVLVREKNQMLTDYDFDSEGNVIAIFISNPQTPQIKSRIDIAKMDGGVRIISTASSGATTPMERLKLNARSLAIRLNDLLYGGIIKTRDDGSAVFDLDEAIVRFGMKTDKPLLTTLDLQKLLLNSGFQMVSTDSEKSLGWQQVAGIPYTDKNQAIVDAVPQQQLNANFKIVIGKTLSKKFTYQNEFIVAVAKSFSNFIALGEQGQAPTLNYDTWNRAYHDPEADELFNVLFQKTGIKVVSERFPERLAKLNAITASSAATKDNMVAEIEGQTGFWKIDLDKIEPASLERIYKELLRFPGKEKATLITISNGDIAVTAVTNDRGEEFTRLLALSKDPLSHHGARYFLGPVYVRGKLDIKKIEYALGIAQIDSLGGQPSIAASSALDSSASTLTGFDVPPITNEEVQRDVAQILEKIEESKLRFSEYYFPNIFGIMQDAMPHTSMEVMRQVIAAQKLAITNNPKKEAINKVLDFMNAALDNVPLDELWIRSDNATNLLLKDSFFRHGVYDFYLTVYRQRLEQLLTPEEAKFIAIAVLSREGRADQINEILKLAEDARPRLLPADIKNFNEIQKKMVEREAVIQILKGKGVYERFYDADRKLKVLTSPEAIKAMELLSHKYLHQAFEQERIAVIARQPMSVPDFEAYVRDRLIRDGSVLRVTTARGQEWQVNFRSIDYRWHPNLIVNDRFSGRDIEIRLDDITKIELVAASSGVHEEILNQVESILSTLDSALAGRTGYAQEFREARQAGQVDVPLHLHENIMRLDFELSHYAQFEENIEIYEALQNAVDSLDRMIKAWKIDQEQWVGREMDQETLIKRVADELIRKDDTLELWRTDADKSITGKITDIIIPDPKSENAVNGRTVLEILENGEIVPVTLDATRKAKVVSLASSAATTQAVLNAFPILNFNIPRAAANSFSFSYTQQLLLQELGNAVKLSPEAKSGTLDADYLMGKLTEEKAPLAFDKWIADSLAGRRSAPSLISSADAKKIIAILVQASGLRILSQDTADARAWQAASNEKPSSASSAALEEATEFDPLEKPSVIAKAKSALSSVWGRKFVRNAMRVFHDPLEVKGIDQEVEKRLLTSLTELDQLTATDAQQKQWQEATISEIKQLPKIARDYIIYVLSASSGVGEVVSPSAISQATDEYGGIDFDPTNMNLQIKRDGKGVPLPLPQQNLEQINIEGLYPVIINIIPVNPQTLPIFLGQAPQEPAKEPELAASTAS